jgi:hypothetical protein
MDGSEALRGIAEKLEQSLSRIEQAGEGMAGPAWVVYLAFSTAIMAVLGSIASLQATTAANYALLLKDDAVIYHVQSADQWSYYQSRGIKGLLYDIKDKTGKGAKADETRLDEQQAERYKSQKSSIKANAQDLEDKAHEKDVQATSAQFRQHDYALSAVMFQVAIALSAIAVLCRQKLLWYGGLLAGADALFFLIKGTFF